MEGAFDAVAGYLMLLDEDATQFDRTTGKHTKHLIASGIAVPLHSVSES